MSVSIIIPYYNVEQDLFNRCICSILEQDYNDYEVIIINDGSKQEYMTVLDEIEKKDHRIRIIHQENHGVSAARNTGLRAATGEFVFLVDADDEITPGSLSEAVKVQNTENADLVIGSISRTHLYHAPENNIEHEIVHYTGNSINSIRHRFIGGEAYRFKNGGFWGKGPYSKLVRSEIAKRTPFNESLAQGEDIVWNLQILEKCSLVVSVDCVWYLYYDNPQSATNKYNREMYSIVKTEMNYIMTLADLIYDKEYVAFCDKLLGELNKVSRCLLSNPKNDLSPSEYRTILNDIYHSEPWIVLKSPRYRKLARRNNKIKRFLYLIHQLMTFYKLKEALNKATNSKE